MKCYSIILHTIVQYHILLYGLQERYEGRALEEAQEQAREEAEPLVAQLGPQELQVGGACYTCVYIYIYTYTHTF